MLEGGAARGAARRATQADLNRLRLICGQTKESAAKPEFYGSDRWAELDHRFHDALAHAAHNPRIASALGHLLTECRYLFYRYLPREGRGEVSPDEAIGHMHNALRDHTELLQLIESGEADAAEQRARADMLKSAEMVTQAMVRAELRSAEDSSTE